MLLVVGLHLALSATMSGPTITDDELGFLANARVLAGGDSTPLQFGFSPTKYAGYSVLLLPLYWFGLDPIGVFRGALAVNAALGGLILLVGYSIARRVWRTSRAVALSVATAVSLYPAVLLNSSFAWSETLLFLLLMLVALTAYQLVDRPTLWHVTAFALCGGLLYFAHPRLLGITALCGVFAVALTLRRHLPPPLLAVCIGLLTVISLGARQMHEWLLPQIYGSEDGSDFAADRAGVYVDVLTTPALFKDFLLNAAGTGWYLGVASLGLIWVSFGALAWIALRPSRDETTALRWYAGFAAVAMLLLIATSAVSLAGGGDRVDYRFYGRYAEAIGPLLLLSALCFLSTLVRRGRALVVCVSAGGIATVLLALVMYFGQGSERFHSVPLQGVTILGALAQSWTEFPVDAGFPVWRTTAVALLALVLVTAVAVRSQRLALGLLCGLFVFAAVAVQDRYISPLSKAIQSTAVLHRSAALDDASSISYDLAAHAGNGTLTLPLNQFYLPKVQYHLFDSASGERPSTDFVVAQATWPDASALGARAVARETGGDQTLWVLPGPTASSLVDAGVLLPEPNAPLSLDAMRSDLQVETQRGAICSGHAGGFRGTVRHEGQGNAWPQTTFTPEGPIPGRVYLVYQWLSADSGAAITPERWAGDLPWTLSPGDAGPVHLTAEATDGEGAPLRAGRYTLRFGLHQDSVGSFWEIGRDVPRNLAINVRECSPKVGGN